MALSSRLMRLYMSNRNVMDWENTSVRKIASSLGIGKNSAVKILAHHSELMEESDDSGSVHLVIGDAHAAPDQDLSRFSYLGLMIRDINPDVVVCIGDFVDMGSLCSYDRGKKSFEGRRYSEDIESGRRALELLHSPIQKHNSSGYGKGNGLFKKCNPRFVYCEGNHEHRIERAKEDNPHLDSMDLSEVGFEEYGWEVHRFLDIASIDGIDYCHYFTSQNTARAVSGVNAARALIQKRHTSSVCGHSHLLNYHHVQGGRGRIHGLVCGWYCDQHMDYAAQSNPGWWNGICVLRNVKEGDFDLELWSYDRIKSTWTI